MIDWRRNSLSDLEQSEGQRQKFKRELNAKSTLVQELQDENGTLRDRLESAKSTPTSCPVTVLVQENEDLKLELRKSKEEYIILSQTKDVLEKNYGFLREVQVEWKAFYQAWQNREGLSDRRSSSLVPPKYPGSSLSPFHSSRPSSSRQKSPNSPTPKEQDPLGPSDFPATQAACRPDEVPKIDDTADMAETAASSTSNISQPQNASLPPPEADDAELPRSTKTSSNNSTLGSSPIIISERSLKKPKPSKRATPEISIHEDATAGARSLKNLKTEDVASSPLQPLRNVNSQGKTGESLDLDEYRGTLYTPRKRQRLHEGSPELQTPQLPSARVDRQAETPRDGMSSNSGLAKRMNSRGMQRPYMSIYDMPLSSPSSEPSQASAAMESGFGEGEGEGHYHNPDMEQGNPVVPQNEAGAAMSASDQMIRDVPTPPSGPPRTSDGRMLCPPSRRDRGAAAVPDVAEDGEPAISLRRRSLEQAKASSRSSSVSSTSPKGSLARPNAYRRLAPMLNRPSAPKSPLTLPKAQPTHGINDLPTPFKQTRQSSTDRPITPQSLPATKNKLAVPATSKSARPASSKRNSPITYPNRRTTAINSERSLVGPEDEPIRARPVHRLRLEDFKLNPKHSEYAFNEILRKHDEKKSRVGCTDPFCQRCKDLRKFVEASNLGMPKTPGMFDSSPPDGSDKAAEGKLMLEYLGGDASRLGQMQEEEKAELLLKAKTKQFADQFGKHRQTYTRAPETAGYWNMDFPSTQENERDREENKVIERMKIEERWQEALRGGMWIFADET